eukprot:11587190-Alexandrium_andersonii.AAC.1
MNLASSSSPVVWKRMRRRSSEARSACLTAVRRCRALRREAREGMAAQGRSSEEAAQGGPVAMAMGGTQSGCEAPQPSRLGVRGT